MINRKTLKCISCGTRVTTRTGIGHAPIQKHKLPCPVCKVEIGFVLNVDQKNPGLKYENPSNAEWDGGAEDSEHTVLFYPELMIPADLQYPISPFIATYGNFKNLEQYQKEEAVRRLSKDNLWPALQRSYVHFENGNLELMKKECQSVATGMPDLANQERRGGWILTVTRHLFDRFVAHPARSERMEKTFAAAMAKAKGEVRGLADEYVKSGRMTALWKELKSVRIQFMLLYESLVPLLMVRRYWKDHLQKIDNYSLSIKNFEDLRPFYVDTVETSFKLLVIGLAVELISGTGKPLVKTKKGDQDIWWFEQLNNGIKDTQLKKFPTLDRLAAALDLPLRNGAGHHSAHYDVNRDEIIYVKADGANLSEIRLSYTQFVSKVFDAYCAFELLTVFFQWFFVAGGGTL
jgi:hypothetical protein